MLGKVFKIISIALFCMVFALACATLICIKANSEAGGYLLFATGIAICVFAVFAIVAIIFGNSSAGAKASKFFLLSTPFLVFVVIVGFAIVIGGAIVCFMLYAAGGILG